MQSDGIAVPSASDTAAARAAGGASSPASGADQQVRLQRPQAHQGFRCQA